MTAAGRTPIQISKIDLVRQFDDADNAVVADDAPEQTRVSASLIKKNQRRQTRHIVPERLRFFVGGRHKGDRLR